ncbi:Hsp20/alpha crystallin family protein [Bacillus aquiflavi]|uniref:Hsp20/alpha crystallin family protein n=1 Tax=Bacillus aquiflavi TaxID=2672567 RepID=A0A6B3W299_9BACI|nr:Hsp20/alpha crystallin family protein [Bacillus aquiflavi]MBA4537837.1 Hsp20/alpha crystallin family protein [Bacillus aquiflavi]NEY82093.1 Hsp20/alpha crystallin family protein [Bacillus aquiflavi]
MSLIPYEPFRQLENIRREFDRVFTDFPAFGTEQNLGGIKVDIHETENEIIAICDLPGLENKEDVDISIENNLLSISGTINRTNELNEKNMYRKERFFGRFHRAISLPSPVSNEGIKATYKNGVLEITMPKAIQDEKKKIDIEFH